MTSRFTKSLLSFAVAACVPAAAFAQDALDEHGKPEPPMKGIHWAKDHAPPAAKPGGSPNLIWHGGNIMDSTTVTTIFWGPSWADASFAGDKMTGLDGFYRGVGGSGYAGTNTEYNDSNSYVGTSVNFVTSYMDLSATPRNVGSRTSTILTEVCGVLQASGQTPVANGYYPVYVDAPRGHAGYCAWHSAGSCGGVNVQFAFFFNLDGDAGCDPQDGSRLHSQGLAALANVSGHEWSEMMTDPRLDAWYDSSGAENSDKCAWVFGTPLLTFSNHTQWKIQGNWSNDAYNTSSGFANRSGQLGCLDGGNYR
jgi:hypothetical protein